MDWNELHERAYGGDVVVRTREVVFLPKDEAAYAAMLREKFPNVVFVDNLGKEQERDWRPPKVVAHRSIVDCKALSIKIFLNADRWKSHLDFRDDLRIWVERGRSYPFGRWYRANRIVNAGRGSDSPTLPNIYKSLIEFTARKSNAEDLKAQRQAIRLIEKAGTRRLQFVEYPSGVSREGVPDFVAGSYAVEWARGASDRFFNIRYWRGAGTAWRPAE
jgi:hypothetical protein